MAAKTSVDYYWRFEFIQDSARNMLTLVNLLLDFLRLVHCCLFYLKRMYTLRHTDQDQRCLVFCRSCHSDCTQFCLTSFVVVDWCTYCFLLVYVSCISYIFSVCVSNCYRYLRYSAICQRTNCLVE